LKKRGGGGGRPEEPAKQQLRVNRRIRAPQIRVIDADGSQMGVTTPEAAMIRAQQLGLDLVEVSPTAKPPVCKIMDFGKYKYQQKKRATEAKKHSSVVTIKEVKFRPKTDDHDFDFKVRNLQRFLSEGHKGKVTIMFSGREMVHQEIGREMLDRIVEQMKEHAIVEQTPKMEGRRLTMVLAPGRTKSAGSQPSRPAPAPQAPVAQATQSERSE
jgi:translation initiation factor IF-3